jgi:hypothetical protein
MTARIYKPAKTAMQSGAAATKIWLLEFERTEAPRVEPLMGWTAAGETQHQVRLRFPTKEEAVAYCERHSIPYELREPTPVGRRPMAYADNFAWTRRELWTH